MNIQDTDSEDDMRSEDEEDDDDLSDEEKEGDINDWEELRNIQFWFLDIVFRCLDLRGVSANKNILTNYSTHH